MKTFHACKEENEEMSKSKTKYLRVAVRDHLDVKIA